MLLSEPTGSLTRWDDNFEQPFITVCPSIPYSNMTAVAIMYCGSDEEKRDFYGNDSLLTFFIREGLSLDDMLDINSPHGENMSQDNGSSLPAEEVEGTWTTEYNYARGGVCSSFKSNKEFQFIQLSKPRLRRAVEFEDDRNENNTTCRVDDRRCTAGDCFSTNFHQRNSYRSGQHSFNESEGSIGQNESQYDLEADGIHLSRWDAPKIAYRIHIHCHNDFWGAEDRHLTENLSDAEMVTFELMNTFNYQEIVIHVDREILPNLRREPCEEDPTYSPRSCWLRCFLQQFNCSMYGGDGKPICSASDMSILHAQMYDAFVAEARTSPIPPCLCQRPCVREHYSLFVRPAVTYGPSEMFTVPVRFRPVRRTIETFVIYRLTDLLADMGGYLGLLLGYSLLSIFDDLKTAARSVFRSMKKVIAGSNDSLSGRQCGARRTPRNEKEAKSRGNHRRSLRDRGWDRRFRWGSKDPTWSYNQASSPWRLVGCVVSHRTRREQSISVVRVYKEA